MIELELGLIISQEDYKGSVEELLREMAFEVVEKLDEV